MSLPSLSVQPQSATIHRHSRQGDDPDWGRFKDIICSLYATNELKNVIRIMEKDHQFKASEKLYKTKFRDWGIDTKRIRPYEYKAMLKKKRKRERVEPGKATKFQLHGEIVPDSKITRWETRMLKQGTIAENDTFSEVGTPPSLTFRTPSPSIASSTPTFKVPISCIPPTESTTALSFNTESPTPATPQWNKLVSECSLFSGSLDQFMAIDASSQPLWRMPTPIIGCTHSPPLNNAHPALTSAPLSNEIMVPPTLNATQHTSIPGFLFRKPTPSLQVPRNIALEHCNRWSSIDQYASSSIGVFNSTPSRHHVEGMVCSISRRNDGHDSQLPFTDIRPDAICNAQGRDHEMSRLAESDGPINLEETTNDILSLDETPSTLHVAHSWTCQNEQQSVEAVREETQTEQANGLDWSDSDIEYFVCFMFGVE